MKSDMLPELQACIPIFSADEYKGAAIMANVLAAGSEAFKIFGLHCGVSHHPLCSPQAQHSDMAGLAAVCNLCSHYPRCAAVP